MNGTKVVVIDYIQLLTVPRVYNLFEKLEIIVTELKSIGDELGLCQFWASQFSKSSRSEGQRPTADGLKGSSLIEEVAWSIAILERGKPIAGTRTTDFTVHFDKARFAETGAIKARLNGAYYDFYLEGQKPLMERIQTLSPLSLI